MAASIISYAFGTLFGAIAILGLFLNITVLLAIYKGKLFSSKFSPVYILSSQTILVDSIILAVHVGYHCPSVMLQSYLFPLSIQPTALRVLNALFILFAIVFYQRRVFTRSRTIALCILQHAAAASLCTTSQFLLPCCEFSFSWVVFSYQYNTKPGLINSSDKYIDQPLDASSSVISATCYATIIGVMHYYRRKAAHFKGDAKRRHKEYRFAIQFATMATVYSLTWIFFRACPKLIGNTSNLHLYGIVTVLAELNMITNSTVYLIKESIRAMLGWSPISSVRNIQSVKPMYAKDRESTLGKVVSMCMGISPNTSLGAAVCRICHCGETSVPYLGGSTSGGEPLISPCHCKGTMGLYHRSCVEHWLTLSGTACCEICLFRFQLKRKDRSFWDYIKQRGCFVEEGRGTMTDVMCFTVLTPFAIGSAYLCFRAGLTCYDSDGQWNVPGDSILDRPFLPCKHKEGTDTAEYCMSAPVSDNDGQWNAPEGIAMFTMSGFLAMVYIMWMAVTVAFYRSEYRSWRKNNQVVYVVDQLSDEESLHFNGPRTPLPLQWIGKIRSFSRSLGRWVARRRRSSADSPDVSAIYIPEPMEVVDVEGGPAMRGGINR
ncbi:hypothetical protein PRIPAC_87981 [Pristionchus pacificus]|nr:hypothetical protein PRIPAC_87981 [Pristionchus pacificus]